MDLAPHGDVAVISSDRAHPVAAAEQSGETKTMSDQAGGGLARHDLYLSGRLGDRGPLNRITVDGNDGWDSIRPKWSPDGRHISVSQRHAGGERVQLLTLSCVPKTRSPRANPKLETGGAEGTRTPDPFHAMEVLYRLSYSPRRELSR